MSRPHASPSQISTSNPASNKNAIAVHCERNRARSGGWSAVRTPSYGGPKPPPAFLLTTSARRGNSMATESAIAVVQAIAATNFGVVTGHALVDRGVSRKRLQTLCRARFLERVLPDTYRVMACPGTYQQRLSAALSWAGDAAAAWATS